MLDVLVVGAGPIGLACGIEARRRGLSVAVFDKGALVNSLLGYPTGMEFFSTPELLEIGGHPLATRRYKPLREEVIDYYRGAAAAERLHLHLYERVLTVGGVKDAFRVTTSRGEYQARRVVVSTGFFDVPNRMDVPGEDLPKVSHYYREPYAYTGQRVAVIGAKNSAAKAALDCLRHGADVTLIVRGPTVSPSVKYWIRPDLENRIREGRIRAYFDTVVREILPDRLRLEGPAGPFEIENDWVLALVGYRPDYALLEDLGLSFEGPARVPVHHPETMESSRPGLYLAGTVCGGLDTSRWFIENGRDHAARIIAHIAAS
jgi:thioredoxin reductase (NADPH)